jgi:hypothetical protein
LSTTEPYWRAGPSLLGSVNGAEADVTSGIYLPRALLDWFDSGARSTRPGVADPLRFGRRLASPALSGSVRTSRSTSNANGGSYVAVNVFQANRTKSAAHSVIWRK